MYIHCARRRDISAWNLQEGFNQHHSHTSRTSTQGLANATRDTRLKTGKSWRSATIVYQATWEQYALPEMEVIAKSNQSVLRQYCAVYCGVGDGNSGNAGGRCNAV